MKRVVITGMGGLTPIGNNLTEIVERLQKGVSGIALCPEFVERGFNSQYKGMVGDFALPEMAKDTKRQLGKGRQLAFAIGAANLAVKDAGLTAEELASAGVLYGQGGGSTLDTYETGAETVKRNAPRCKTANGVSCTMASGGASIITTHFLCKGGSYMASAACATGNYAIGQAVRHILFGDAPIFLAGAGDSSDWVMSAPFDFMQAMTRDKYDVPAFASRPFDKKRSGFVMGEGSGVFVVEDLDHAKARGARIICEVIGYGFSSDGTGNATDPDVDGAARSMLMALKGFYGQTIDPASIDYVKTHGTSTEKGDDNELQALVKVFGEGGVPPIGATKGWTGHALGGAGGIEGVFGALMIKHGFMAGGLHIDEPSDMVVQLGLEGSLLRETLYRPVNRMLLNSFGFGGTNATLVLAAYNG